jgi:hypothetical protein
MLAAGEHDAPFSPPCADLCQSHNNLDPRLMHHLFHKVQFECTIRMGNFRQSKRRKEYPVIVENWIRRIDQLTVLLVGRANFRGMYFYDCLDGNFPPVPQYCAACLCAVLGGNLQLLTDLRANMLVRALMRAHAGLLDQEPAHLRRFVDSWIANFGKELQAAAETESDRLSKILWQIREAQWEEKEAGRRRRQNERIQQFVDLGGAEGLEKGLMSACEATREGLVVEAVTARLREGQRQAIRGGDDGRSGPFMPGKFTESSKATEPADADMADGYRSVSSQGCTMRISHSTPAALQQPRAVHFDIHKKSADEQHEGHVVGGAGVDIRVGNATNTFGTQQQQQQLQQQQQEQRYGLDEMEITQLNQNNRRWTFRSALDKLPSRKDKDIAELDGAEISELRFDPRINPRRSMDAAVVPAKTTGGTGLRPLILPGIVDGSFEIRPEEFSFYGADSVGRVVTAPQTKDSESKVVVTMSQQKQQQQQQQQQDSLRYGEHNDRSRRLTPAVSIASSEAERRLSMENCNVPEPLRIRKREAEPPEARRRRTSYVLPEQYESLPIRQSPPPPPLEDVPPLKPALAPRLAIRSYNTSIYPSPVMVESPLMMATAASSSTLASARSSGVYSRVPGMPGRIPTPGSTASGSPSPSLTSSSRQDRKSHKTYRPPYLAPGSQNFRYMEMPLSHKSFEDVVRKLEGRNAVIRRPTE